MPPLAPKQINISEGPFFIPGQGPVRQPTFEESLAAGQVRIRTGGGGTSGTTTQEQEFVSSQGYKVAGVITRMSIEELRKGLAAGSFGGPGSIERQAIVELIISKQPSRAIVAKEETIGGEVVRTVGVTQAAIPPKETVKQKIEQVREVERLREQDITRQIEPSAAQRLFSLTDARQEFIRENVGITPGSEGNAIPGEGTGGLKFLINQTATPSVVQFGLTQEQEQVERMIKTQPERTREQLIKELTQKEFRTGDQFRVNILTPTGQQQFLERVTESSKFVKETFTPIVGERSAEILAGFTLPFSVVVGTGETIAGGVVESLTPPGSVFLLPGNVVVSRSTIAGGAAFIGGLGALSGAGPLQRLTVKAVPQVGRAARQLATPATIRGLSLGERGGVGGLGRTPRQIREAELKEIEKVIKGLQKESGGKIKPKKPVKPQARIKPEVPKEPPKPKPGFMEKFKVPEFKEVQKEVPAGPTTKQIIKVQVRTKPKVEKIRFKSREFEKSFTEFQKRKEAEAALKKSNELVRQKRIEAQLARQLREEERLKDFAPLVKKKKPLFAESETVTVRVMQLEQETARAKQDRELKPISLLGIKTLTEPIQNTLKDTKKATEERTTPILVPRLTDLTETTTSTVTRTGEITQTPGRTFTPEITRITGETGRSGEPGRPPKEPGTPKIPKLKPFPLPGPGPGIKQLLRQNKEPGYDVFGRQKGRTIKLNKKLLARGEALDLLRTQLDNTTGASGFVKRKGVIATPLKPNVSPSLFKFKVTGTKDVVKLVERNKYRIDTPGEVQGIPLKAAKLRRAGLLGNKKYSVI